MDFLKVDNEKGLLRAGKLEASPKLYFIIVKLARSSCKGNLKLKGLVVWRLVALRSSGSFKTKPQLDNTYPFNLSSQTQTHHEFQGGAVFA